MSFFGFSVSSQVNSQWWWLRVSSWYKGCWGHGRWCWTAPGWPDGFCRGYCRNLWQTFRLLRVRFWWLLVVAVTNSPKYRFNRCKSATCKFLSRDTKSARDKNGTKPRKNKVKNTSPEISLVEYLCFVCKGTNLSLEKRGEIPISLIHNSFSYHCTPNVVFANGFDLKQHGLQKSCVKFCFALCWTFSKTRPGNRTKDLPPLLSNPWFWECLNDRYLKMQNFKWVSDQSATLQHGKIDPKNWKSALLINHNDCLNIIGNNIPLQPKSITK